MRDPRESNHPPSDPHPALTRGNSAAAFAADERPMRLQLAGALLFGIVLVAAGLYLWRRPHKGTPGDEGGEQTAAESASAGGALPIDEAGIVSGAVDAGAPSRVHLSEARVVACMDRGPKKTPPEECDHLKPVEDALSHAIEQTAGCVPPAGPAGTIEYVADISFTRHKVRILLPRAGRSVSDRKVVGACGAAVRSAVQSLALESMDHTHARYKIALTATY
ncbi:MAG: hypothetical protein ACRENE_14425 [Polyangiaceae bacterium]